MISQMMAIIHRAITPFISGYIIQYLGWKYILLISAILSLISLFLAIPYENIRMPQQQRVRIDFLGIIAITTLTSTVCIALTLLADKKYVVAAILVVVAALSAVAFYFVEKRHPQPILPLQLLGNPVSALLFLNIAVYVIFIGQNWLLSQILNDPVETGYVQLIANVFSVPITGVMIVVQKKFTNRVISAFGIVTSILTFAMAIPALLNYNKLFYEIVYVVAVMTVLVAVQTIYL